MHMRSKENKHLGNEQRDHQGDGLWNIIKISVENKCFKIGPVMDESKSLISTVTREKKETDEKVFTDSLC